MQKSKEEDFVEDILKQVDNKQNLFITGAAGSGKSFILRKITDFLKQKNENYIALAPTGVAAENIDGRTLSSFFKLETKNFVNRDDLLKSAYATMAQYNIWQKKPKSKKSSSLQYYLNNIKEIKYLIIDEISMVCYEDLLLYDDLMKIYKNEREPFGGVCVIFIGDFLQLNPISKESSLIFENTEYLKQLNLKIYLLDKIKRQDNHDFISELLSIRKGFLNNKYIEVLIDNFENIDIEKSIYLVATNKIADLINDLNLKKLKTHLWSNTIERSPNLTRQHLDNFRKIEENLKLKIGCRVMMIVNEMLYDKEDEKVSNLYFNGSMGEVIDFEDDEIVVLLDNGRVVNVKNHKWDVYENVEVLEKNEKNIFVKVIKQQKVGEIKQYPLKLAYAITIHKSQGLSLDNVIVDAKGIFSDGQLYVALSRIKNPLNSTLTNFKQYYLKASKSAVDFYNKLESNIDNSIIIESQFEKINTNEGEIMDLKQILNDKKIYKNFKKDFEIISVLEKQSPKSFYNIYLLKDIESNLYLKGIEFNETSSLKLNGVYELEGKLDYNLDFDNHTFIINRKKYLKQSVQKELNLPLINSDKFPQIRPVFGFNFNNFNENSSIKLDDFTNIKKDYGIDKIITTSKNIDAYNTIDNVKQMLSLNLKDDLGMNIIINKKDRNLKLKEINYTFFDLESTGLSSLINELIEYASVDYNFTIGENNYNQFFVKINNKLSDKIKELTHISDEQLSEGDPIEIALDKIREIFKDNVIVAHNAEFDFSFLQNLYKKYNKPLLDNICIDTLNLARALFPTDKVFKLQSLADKFEIKYSLEEAHRADFDTNVLKDVYIEMIKLLEEKNIYDLNDLKNFNKSELKKLARGYEFEIIFIQNNYEDFMLENLEYISDLFLLKEKYSILIGSSTLQGIIWNKFVNHYNLNLYLEYIDFIGINPYSVYELLIKENVYSQNDLKLLIKYIFNLAIENKKLIVYNEMVYFLENKYDDFLNNTILLNESNKNSLFYHWKNTYYGKIYNMYLNNYKDYTKNIKILGLNIDILNKLYKDFKILYNISIY